MGRVRGKDWMQEHVADRYVRRAQREGMRSRAAFKLEQIAGRDRLLRPGMTVVDLGAAPGGWSQVAAKRVGAGGRVIALDVLEMVSLPGVTFVPGDFREQATVEALERALEGRGVDLVLCDLAPNLTGVKSVDQARAIDELSEGLTRGDTHQVLLGVTGSGKTFTMAQTIARVNRPTLVMAHNKTLAAQLFQEFRRFFPDNAVEYFVSYYDYYQPEAYVPATDSYIEKEATINDEIDRMRLSATRSLFERRDVIIVASVSCIYGLGSPEAYYGMVLPLERGQKIGRDQILRKLVEIQYERNDMDFGRGTFRVRGDIIEVYPSYEEMALRIGLFGDEIDELVTFDPLTGKASRRHDRTNRGCQAPHGRSDGDGNDGRRDDGEERDHRIRRFIDSPARTNAKTGSARGQTASGREFRCRWYPTLQIVREEDDAHCSA